MSDSAIFISGSLFTTDYLAEAIKADPAYLAVDAVGLRIALGNIAAAFPQSHKTNESQTEDDFIWPVLGALGWSESLRQQNLTVSGRDDVPDGLLFLDADAKAAANALDEQWKRYAHGLAVVESKRWARPLDRASGRDEATAPSTQMLRYLRRIDDLTSGQLRWGILTNGTKWRLYWAGARSVSEEFLEIDLGRVLALDGVLPHERTFPNGATVASRNCSLQALEHHCHCMGRIAVQLSRRRGGTAIRHIAVRMVSASTGVALACPEEWLNTSARACSVRQPFNRRWIVRRRPSG